VPESPPDYPDESNGESRLISFIVHVWKENSSSEEDQVNWRGHITPALGGKRYYFTNLWEIPDWITSHMKQQK
jgi:hypothetical protein